MKTKAGLSLFTLSLIALVLMCGLGASAQDQVTQQPTTSAIPNLIRYGGVLKDANGAALASQTLGVTFALYKQQEGGVALWTETRNVTTNAAGQYSVMLGSTKPEGMSAELFSEQEQRWLSVQVQGQPEQSRVLMVSVPYAFQAHEAETLGGLPASAFVKSAADASSTGSADAGITGNASSATASGKTAASAGQTQDASKDGVGWVRNGQVLKLMTDTDKVGIGTSNPMTKLEVVGDIHASGKISSGNATVTMNGNENSITVDSVAPIGGLANQLYIGGEDASNTTPFDKIQVGIGTKTLGGEKLAVFDKVFPVIGLSAPTFIGGAEWALATCVGCFSNFAVPGDTVLRTGAGNSKNLILTVRGSQNGAIRFGTGPTASETEKMTLLNNGNFGIGYNLPKTLFSVGPPYSVSPTLSPFEVDNLGDMVMIKNVAYSWPTGYGTGGGPYALTDPVGNGSLVWSKNSGGGGGTVLGTCHTGTQALNYITKWLDFTTVQCSSIYENTTAVPIGPQVGIGTTTFTYVPSLPPAKLELSYTDATSTDPSVLRLHNTEANAGFTETGIEFDTAVGPAGSHNPDEPIARIYAKNDGVATSGGRFSIQVKDGHGNFDNVFNVKHTGPNIGQCCVGGAVGIATTVPAATLDVNGGNAVNDPIGNVRVFELDPFVVGLSEPVCRHTLSLVLSKCPSSSRRFKEQIADMGDSSSKLFQLRPVTYFYKPQYDDGSHQLQHGLVAEEVAKIYPDLVEYEKDGTPYTVKYQMLAPLLLNEFQKQHAVVTAQQTEVQALSEQTKAQQQQMLAQQQEIEGLKSQLQMQNAAFQERLSRLESLVTTQMQTAAADKPSQVTTTATGGLQ